jgi:hypothetical protein
MRPSLNVLTTTLFLAAVACGAAPAKPILEIHDVIFAYTPTAATGSKSAWLAASNQPGLCERIKANRLAPPDATMLVELKKIVLSAQGATSEVPDEGSYSIGAGGTGNGRSGNATLNSVDASCGRQPESDTTFTGQIEVTALDAVAGDQLVASVNLTYLAGLGSFTTQVNAKRCDATTVSTSPSCSVP